MLLQPRREADFLQILTGALFGFRRFRPSTLTGASMMFSSTFMCVHRLKCWNTIDSLVRTRCNCLGSARAARRSRFCVRTSSPSTKMRPAFGLLEKVDAAQHRALARTGRADHADHVAGVGLQRHALEDFVVAVLFVKLVDEELLLLGVHRGPWRAYLLGTALTCLAAAGKRASGARRGGTATRAQKKCTDRAGRRGRTR